MVKKKKEPDFLDEVKRNVSNFHRERDEQMNQLNRDIANATGTTSKESCDKEGAVNSSLNASQKNIIIMDEAKGKCEYPNCDVQAYLDVHHIIPSSEGGSNKFSNLIVLCPTHHRMAGSGGISKDRLRVIIRNRKKTTE